MSTTYAQFKVGTLTYSGPIDFENFYNNLHGWLTNKRYKITEHSFKEDQRKQEVSFNWVASKGITDEITFEIKIKFNITNIRPHAGRWIANIKAVVNADVEFESYSPLNNDIIMSFIRRAIGKYIHIGAYDDWRGLLHKEAGEFYNEIAAVLELHKRAINA